MSTIYGCSSTKTYSVFFNHSSSLLVKKLLYNQELLTHLQLPTRDKQQQKQAVWHLWQRRGREINMLTWHHTISFNRSPLGPIGPSTLPFLKELGRCISQTSRDPRSTQFLLQRLSIAVQRGNALAVLGSARGYD